MINLLLFIGCFKTYIIDGQLRDTNGRPVNNAIVRIPNSNVETRSDKKGRFQLEVKFQKKLAPYIMDIHPLAHEKKSTDLELETQKDKEIDKKIILEPKKIFLPYSSINLDLLNKTIETKKEEEEPSGSKEAPTTEEAAPKEATETPGEESATQEEKPQEEKATEPPQKTEPTEENKANEEEETEE